MSPPADVLGRGGPPPPSDVGHSFDRPMFGGVTPPFAEVVVVDSLEASERAWTTLAAVAPASPYQSWAWTRAWIETEGLASAVRPMIVIASDARGRPVALLPLVVGGSRWIRTATFAGGKHSNYNMGLFAHGTAWTAADVSALLRQAARQCPGRLDVFSLVNQPMSWDGMANPLAALPGQASPSSGHRARLQPDAEAFFRQCLSAAARKKLRSKAAQLAALGPVAHRIARTRAEIDAILTVHLVQKAAKLAALGIRRSEEDLSTLRRLLDRAALDGSADGAPPLEMHALFCGDRIVATFGGLTHAGRFSGLIISHDGDPVFARLSPGEQLLSAVMRLKCEAGLTSFDLGIGEARYKDAYCPIADPLVDCFVPVTRRGRLMVAAETTRLRMKRRIKGSVRLWSAVRAIRRTVGRWRPA